MPRAAGKMKWKNLTRRDHVEKLLKEAAEKTKKVMSGVKASQFSDPTPCKDFDVKALANHMAGLAMGSERAAKKLDRIAPPDPMPDMIGDNPGAAYAPLADAAVAAWSSSGAFDGETQFGPGPMPAQVAGAITLMEIAVHGWDLAAATGQTYSMSPDLAVEVQQTVQQLASPESRENGVFGPEISVDASSSVQDQLLGLSGRDPEWSA